MTSTGNNKQVTTEPDNAADALLSVARHLVAQNSAQHAAPENINLDSDIVTDLGFDSLARVELFDRIEKQCGVQLDETLFSEAVKLRDLLPAMVGDVQAVLREEDRAQSPLPEESDILDTPEQAKTLVDVVQWYVERQGSRQHILFFEDDLSGESISNLQLLQRAQAVAAGLQGLGIGPQHPVAIMLPTCADYFYCFLGILLAGGIPVPLYPPARPAQIEDHVRRHASILHNCGASVLITVKQAKIIAHLLKSQVDAVKHVVTVDELRGDAASLQAYTNRPDDIAFIQYTSGSTGTPKGVMLTHSNLLANIRAMGRTLNASSKDVFVSWLPLYHDMGLIGAWLGSQYYGARLVVMSPLSFLAKPQRWLWALHHYRGTLSASPNFGYELCVRRVDEDQLRGLDLSHWRAAFNGAEAVSPETVKQFYRKFSHYKLQRKALMPVYGLAENSVGLTLAPLDRGPLVDRIQRQPFMDTGRAVPAAPEDTTAIQFISCGRVLMNHQIRIVDGNGRPLPDRQQGQLQFRGPSATRGYYRNPEQSEALFCDGWLDSGDLAYIAKDEVYLTGRTKDMIIRGGRNIYPAELEEVVGKLPGIRDGRVAVFGSTDPLSGTERLVVLTESREKDHETLAQLRAAVNEQVNDLVGLPPDDVVLAPPGTVLKTSSGKIRRAASKALYESGVIGKGQRKVWWQLTRLFFASISAQLMRLWRQATTVAYGLYARTVLWVLAPPTWLLVVVLPRSSWRWAAVRGAAKLLVLLTATPFRVEGREHLPPPHQPCVYVCNHASYLDGPCVVSALKEQVSFVAKAELSRSLIAGLFLKRIGAKFVERFDLQKSVDDAQQFLQAITEGKSLLFFPEGTFVREEGLLPFHMGAFVTAAQAGVCVVPVAIDGTRQVFRAGDCLPRRHSVKVIIGKPIYPDAHDSKFDVWSAAVTLRDQSRQWILKQVPESEADTRRS